VAAIVDVSPDEAPESAVVKGFDEPEQKAAGLAARGEEIGGDPMFLYRVVYELAAHDQAGLEGEFERGE